MRGARFARPSSHYRALFDVAGVTFHPDEAEIEIALDDDELTVSLPAAERTIDPAAMDAARSALSHLVELDALAVDYLFALPNWPHGEDAGLWLLVAQGDNVRFCYAQAAVNDEQVICFTREGDVWAIRGADPRRRGKGGNPYIRGQE